MTEMKSLNIPNRSQVHIYTSSITLISHLLTRDLKEADSFFLRQEAPPLSLTFLLAGDISGGGGRRRRLIGFKDLKEFYYWEGVTAASVGTATTCCCRCSSSSSTAGILVSWIVLRETMGDEEDEEDEGANKTNFSK